jgi:hypothetical protein
VSVSAGGTLGGSGTIGGATTIANGGKLSPGASPGILTFSSSLNLSAVTASSLVFELGTTSDLVVLTSGALDIGSSGDPLAAMDALDTAIDDVSRLRGRLGATQNRLGSTINNLAAQSENLEAAQSRIRDVDVAYETPMAIVNRDLAGVETIFMLPSPAHAHVSSSLVRQVASLGGDVSHYVPSAVARYLQQS